MKVNENACRGAAINAVVPITTYYALSRRGSFRFS